MNKTFTCESSICLKVHLFIFIYQLKNTFLQILYELVTLKSL